MEAKAERKTNAPTHTHHAYVKVYIILNIYFRFGFSICSPSFYKSMMHAK